MKTVLTNYLKNTTVIDFCISERIVHDEEDAKECVNDTWLRTWNTDPPSRPSVLSTFLAKIVRNLSLTGIGICTH